MPERMERTRLRERSSSIWKRGKQPGVLLELEREVANDLAGARGLVDEAVARVAVIAAVRAQVVVELDLPDPGVGAHALVELAPVHHAGLGGIHEDEGRDPGELRSPEHLYGVVPADVEKIVIVVLDFWSEGYGRPLARIS